MLKRDKYCILKKIFIVNVVYIENHKIKVNFYSDLFLSNETMKGYFLESFTTYNIAPFEFFSNSLFNKWLYVAVDLYGNLLYLYHKKTKINLQANTLRQFIND